MISSIKQLDSATDAEFSELMQGVVERLVKAKWIKGFAFVSPRTAMLQLTDLGKSKVERLAKYLQPFEAHCFIGETSQARRWDKLKLMFMLRIYANALFFPWLTNVEEQALTTLLAMESRKFRAQIPG